MEQIVLEHIGKRSFVVLPGVFNPNVFRSARCLAEYLESVSSFTKPDSEATALDVGTGSGIQAVVLASLGYDVTAIDINPRAVRCATINAVLNRMENRIRVLESDLFAEIDGRRFDLVVCNPPFFKGEAKTDFEMAWRSTDLVDRFAAGLTQVLKPGGKALVAWSSYAGESQLLEPLLRANLHANAVKRQRVGAETLIVYEAAPR
jgi:HemK-related putative methylase